jgi:3-hydroxyisobutyrate dehydrogenase-like beta-hydroxyacid dehydrogenase
MKIGFIGLGGMGQPIAQNLVTAGHDLAVYNRTRARAEGLREQGVQVAESPAEAATGREVVITMLADDRAVEEVVLGDDGLARGLARGALHVSSSTISVDLSKRLASMHQALAQGYVAAPVFGRPDAAAAQQLWIVTAGAPADVERCAPIFSAIGRGVTVLGPEAPDANVVKLAGNFIIASMLESLAEAFAFSRKSGVAPAALLEVYRAVFASSAIFEKYASVIAAEAYLPAGFTMHLGLKDVQLALAASAAAEVPMPIASVVRDQMISAIAQGRGEHDWSALAELAAERAGLGPSGR